VPRIVAGRYRLVKKLGQGGMGLVWAAWDELLGREVALKELLLPPGMSDSEARALRERALREARAIARLAHPNIVRFFDVVLDDGLPWIVMELVPSRSLHEVVREDGPLPPERVARIGLDLLAALRAAHAEGVLHRDVKPANVLITTGGRVVLTDFGLVALAGDAALTTTGIVMGSPSFMAPEQARDEPIGPASDLWSLGATLYLAVEGEPPYQRRSPVSTLAALATEPPRPPRRAGALAAALGALLEKDPARRAGPETAEQLLRRAAGEPPAAAPPRRAGRVLWPVAALAVAGLAATAALLHPFDRPAGAQAHGPQGAASVAPLAPSTVPATSASPTTPAKPSTTPPSTPAGRPAVRSASSKPRASSSTGAPAVAKDPDLSKFNTVYYLAHANNLYMTADEGGASPLIAYPDSPGAWETFDEIDLGNGDIALRAEINNKFVTATATGTLIARSDHVGPAETFGLVFNRDGSVSFKSHSNGRYVTVPAGTAKPLLCAKTSIGDTEEFTRTIIGQSG
jgi:serine/threonine protein kinase